MSVVIDSSALVALVQAESEAVRMARWLREDPERLVGAVSFLESVMVLEARRGLAGRMGLEAQVRSAGIKLVPFDLAQMQRACDAYRRFGKGRHPAALNMGDCATYALVTSGDHKLLCKGNDFTRTDIAGRILPLGEGAP